MYVDRSIKSMAFVVNMFYISNSCHKLSTVHGLAVRARAAIGANISIP